MPALDLAWNEPKAAERLGTRCPLHANPVVVVCPLVVDASQESKPETSPTRRFVRSCMTPRSSSLPSSSLPLPDSLQSPRGSLSFAGRLATNLDTGRHVDGSVPDV
jgi:hypothetical protein